jgi:cysteine desulfurase
MTAYFDCNATTPIEPEVAEVVRHYLCKEYGNAGSASHVYGWNAFDAVRKARRQVAEVAGCGVDDVVFTSGATESNNLAILGIAKHAIESRRRHVVTTRIEHKSVLEPIKRLEPLGFEVTWVSPDGHGRISANDVLGAVRPDTALVSVMQVNNETGVIQPIDAIAGRLDDERIYFHVDAAQGFGKCIEPLCNTRIDLISVSGHKLFAPKGVGALIVRTRNGRRAPISPLMFGGGQELGLRPGTLPVALIAGFGEACSIALRDQQARWMRVRSIRRSLMDGLGALNPIVVGTGAYILPNVANCIFPSSLDAGVLRSIFSECVASSSGSACNSGSGEASHVLTSMGLPEADAKRAIRFSWCHLSEDVDWEGVAIRVTKAQRHFPLKVRDLNGA